MKREMKLIYEAPLAEELCLVLERGILDNSPTPGGAEGGVPGVIGPEDEV